MDRLQAKKRSWRQRVLGVAVRAAVLPLLLMSGLKSALAVSAGVALLAVVEGAIGMLYHQVISQVGVLEAIWRYSPLLLEPGDLLSGEGLHLGLLVGALLFGAGMSARGRATAAMVLEAERARRIEKWKNE